MIKRPLAPGPADYDRGVHENGEDGATRSALGEALDAVGDRWTLLVVEALLDGARRFNDLQEALP